MDFVRKVAAYCRDSGLLHRDECIVIACSGGPDSLALLDVFSRLRQEWRLRLVVCYVHHGIRAAADREAAVVERAAMERECAFYCHRVRVPQLAAATRESIETAGRKVRYRLLRQTAAAVGAAAIAVAHHRDDQAETVLHHFLRGSGTAGLCGMRARNRDIIRPFLGVTRREIEAYVAARKLPVQIDETNFQRFYLRNRLRLDLLPLLRQYNPAVTEDLNRLAAVMQGEDDFLCAYAAALGRKYVRPGSGGWTLSVDALMAQPVAMRRRLIRIGVSKMTATPITFQQVETILALAAKATGKEFRMKGVRVVRSYRELCFLPPVARRKTTVSSEASVVAVNGPGSYRLGKRQVVLAGAVTPPVRDNVLLRCGTVTAWQLRYRRPGDYICLQNGSTKKLKKFFIDQKIPASRRDQIPLLCNGQEIIWICGYAVNSRYFPAAGEDYIRGWIQEETV